MSYGKHQSFYLKRHWINKGIKALENEGSKALIDKNKYKNLGIGKNMHQSLRYWLESTHVVEHKNEESVHELTFFGELLKQYDPACSNKFSKMILQYYLVRDYDDKDYRKADAFYWFFIENQDRYITKQSFKDGLIDYSENKVSPNTLGRDVDCLFQTYTNKEKKHPEDKNVSLLAELNLLKKEKDYYYKQSIELDDESVTALYFIIRDYMDENNLTIDSIESNVGSMFNMYRSNLIEAIEHMQDLGYPVRITRTNNLDTIVFDEDVEGTNELLKHLFERVFADEN